MKMRDQQRGGPGTGLGTQVAAVGVVSVDPGGGGLGVGWAVGSQGRAEPRIGQPSQCGTLGRGITTRAPVFKVKLSHLGYLRASCLT